MLVDFQDNGTVKISMTKEEFFKHFNTTGKSVETQKPIKQDNSSIEQKITDILNKIGMPRHVRGFHFAREAIILSINDKSYISNITKRLYPDIATNNSTMPSRVERAIRHAIGIAWSRGDVDYIEELFGYSVNAMKGQPINSEFIALIADKYRLERNEM